MEFKGTKGYWIFRKNGNQTIKVIGGKTKKVCEISCNNNNRIDYVNEANAHLIASAPEMFDVCVELSQFRRNLEDGKPELNTVERMNNLWDMSDKAIKKATNKD